MPNIAYFEVPADDVGRAKKFYHGLLGWNISAPGMPMPDIPESMEYNGISTGDPLEGTLNMGGMYKRQMDETGIRTYAMVGDLDRLVPKVTQLGGKILAPKMEIKGVGFVVIIQDTEGNTIGLWQPEKK